MDIARQYKLRRPLSGSRDSAFRTDERAAMPLHIRCGDDILDTLGSMGVPGHRSRWVDPLCEGPIHPWKTDLDRRRGRAVYLAARYFLSYGEVLKSMGLEDSMLDDAIHYRETILWFEHDLFDQLILAFVLIRLGEAVADGRVSLICIDRHPSTERFIGLGQLDGEALVKLLPERKRVTATQVALAKRVWAALRAPTPLKLAELTVKSHRPLPFLRPGLQRYLAQYPSVENGLGRTEQWGLEAIAAGAATAADAFVQVQAREAAPFQGDSMFYAMVRGLCEGPRPLLAVESRLRPVAKLRDPQFQDRPLRLTPAGEAILGGRDDWFRLNGTVRWIGGVSLIGPEPAWRWDEKATAIVDCR